MFRPTPAQGLFAVCLLAVIATAAMFGFAGDATYERIGIWESVHRGMFRAPACDQIRCAVQRTTYAMETLVQLHRGTAAFVVASASELPPSPTRGAFYTDPEVAYLSQLRNGFVVLVALAAGGAIGIVTLTARASKRAPLIRGGAAIAAAIGALLVATAILAPDGMMRIVARIVGTSEVSFDQRFNIYWLYPATYGQTVLTSVALAIPVATGLAAAAAHLWMNRARLHRVETQSRVERYQTQHGEQR